MTITIWGGAVQIIQPTEQATQEKARKEMHHAVIIDELSPGNII